MVSSLVSIAIFPMKLLEISRVNKIISANADSGEEIDRNGESMKDSQRQNGGSDE